MELIYYFGCKWEQPRVFKFDKLIEKLWSVKISSNGSKMTDSSIKDLCVQVLTDMDQETILDVLGWWNRTGNRTGLVWDLHIPPRPILLASKWNWLKN